MQNHSPYERYQRQIILKDFGEFRQKKLTEAKVLVVGAGGLGCPALQYLAAAGVGRIGIVDYDTVSLSNLHRQILYHTADVGKKKATLAALHLSSLNSGVSIEAYDLHLTNQEAFDLIKEYDLVLDCTDNFATRYMINDACVLLNKALIYGAISQYQGQVAVFNLKDKTGVTTNYRDLFPEPPKNGEVPGCDEAGVIGVLPGIIGNMQAAEAIKIITGLGEPLANKLFTYDLLSNNSFILDIASSEIVEDGRPRTETGFTRMDYIDICADKSEPAINEINFDEFMNLLSMPDVHVVDVREEGKPLGEKFKAFRVPLSVLIENWNGLEAKQLIFVCQKGISSRKAAKLAHERFGDRSLYYSLRGGISSSPEMLG